MHYPKTITQMNGSYEFSTDWFTRKTRGWEKIIVNHDPRSVLEIGSWEGRSACYLIDRCTEHHSLTLCCLDSWGGGIEHSAANMAQVERRFDQNTRLAISLARHPVTLTKIKAQSPVGLAQLIAMPARPEFDLIYIDASHQAPDVLTDAVMAFQLLKIDGVMIFDDYLWSMERAGEQDLLHMPKPAIDAFVNLFIRKLRVIHGQTSRQFFISKTAS